MKYKAVLFDMDGVLIDSEWLMRDTAIQSLAEHGVQAKHEDFREFTGMGEDRFIGGVAEKHGLKYEFFMKERAYDFFGQRVMTDTKVPEGVKDMLETLHRRGIKMAVCSAADRRKVMYNLMAIGVSEELFIIAARSRSAGRHRRSYNLGCGHQTAEPSADGRGVRPHDGCQHPAYTHADTALNNPAGGNRHGLLRPDRIYRLGHTARRPHTLPRGRPPHTDARLGNDGSRCAAAVRHHFEDADLARQYHYGTAGNPHRGVGCHPQ